MKKYMIMALMPFIFQASLHAESKFADIDQRLAKEYENACQSIHSNAKPHFEAVLQALELNAKKGGNKRIVALGHIVAMQKLLQAYRAEEISKLSYYSWTVGSKPTLITQEIDPALKHISKALKNLKVSTSEYSVAAIAAGSIVALVSATAVGLWLVGAEGRTKLLQGKNPFASKTSSVNQKDFVNEDYLRNEADYLENEKAKDALKKAREAIFASEKYIRENKGRSDAIEYSKMIAKKASLAAQSGIEFAQDYNTHSKKNDELMAACQKTYSDLLENLKLFEGYADDCKYDTQIALKVVKVAELARKAADCVLKCIDASTSPDTVLHNAVQAVEFAERAVQVDDGNASLEDRILVGSSSVVAKPRIRERVAKAAPISVSPALEAAREAATDAHMQAIAAYELYKNHPTPTNKKAYDQASFAASAAEYRIRELKKDGAK